MSSTVPRLLAISDAALLAGHSLADWLGELETARVDAVQIREKKLGDRALYELVTYVRRLWRRTLLVNARVDIAQAAGADGVHLPSTGVPIAALRRRFGTDLLIGRSTHHPDEVEAAREAGADYVSFGPIFATPSKARYGRPLGLSGLEDAAALGLPVLALGGVGPEETASAAAAGAWGVAGIRAFHDPPTLAMWERIKRDVWRDH